LLYQRRTTLASLAQFKALPLDGSLTTKEKRNESWHALRGYLGLQKLQRGEVDDLDTLEPMYLKDFVPGVRRNGLSKKRGDENDAML